MARADATARQPPHGNDCVRSTTSSLSDAERHQKRGHGPAPSTQPSQFPSQFSLVQVLAYIADLALTSTDTRRQTCVNARNRNWKSCWVLQPSRVQIPHPPLSPSRNAGHRDHEVTGVGVVRLIFRLS